MYQRYIRSACRGRNILGTSKISWRWCSTSRGINQHPSASDVLTSDAHADDILDPSREEPAMVKNGGYRHLRRERGFLGPRGAAERDRWGPGARVPTLINSPSQRRVTLIIPNTTR